MIAWINARIIQFLLMHISFASITFFGTCLVVNGFAALQAPQPETPSFPDEQAVVERLAHEWDVLVPKLLEEKGVPGVSIAVVRGGKITLAKAYGWADKSKGTSVTPTTRFQVGSVSKTLAAWAVMTLVEQGRVDLDAPVDRHLKRWHLPKSEFGNNKVTVRRLLSHTSGLSVYPSEDIGLSEKPLPLEVALSRDRGGTYGKLRVVREPGNDHEYNNGNYSIVQLLIEDVTGEPFATYTRRTILDPLGMKESGYEWSVELQTLAATPYDEDGHALPHYQNTNWEASGGLYTTASDLARFVAAAMPGVGSTPPGRGLLKPETVAQMFVPAPKTDGMHTLCYKVMPVSKIVRLLSHNGANPGWRAAFMFHPESGNGIVVLTNSDIGGGIVGQIVCAWSRLVRINMTDLCDSVEKPDP